MMILPYMKSQKQQSRATATAGSHEDCEVEKVATSCIEMRCPLGPAGCSRVRPSGSSTNSWPPAKCEHGKDRFSVPRRFLDSLCGEATVLRLSVHEVNSWPECPVRTTLARTRVTHGKQQEASHHASLVAVVPRPCRKPFRRKGRWRQKRPPRSIASSWSAGNIMDKTLQLLPRRLAMYNHCKG